MEIQARATTQELLVEDIMFAANSPMQNSSSSNQPKITITAKAFQKAKQHRSNRVVTIIYQNNKLFPVFTDTQRSGKQNDRRTEDVGSIVLAGKFKDAAINDVEDAIELQFSKDENNGKFLPRCVYWDFNANGRWLIMYFPQLPVDTLLSTATHAMINVLCQFLAFKLEYILSKSDCSKVKDEN